MTSVPSRQREIVVVGAGVAGLSAALALHAKGFHVTILERDPAPPPDTTVDWHRRGVPHGAHPHFFMGRLRKLLSDNHPRLLERMTAGGVGERRFTDYVHSLALDSYRAEQSDALLTALAARRAFFELLMRQYVEDEKIATIVSDANVTGLMRAAGESPVNVQGVTAEVGGETRTFEGIVVDASGRTGRLDAMLAAAGARFEFERHDCRLYYFTRWYRLKAGCSFPAAAGLPGLIFPDYVIGALPADNGAFTVTIQVHSGDNELMALARDPDRFQHLCEQLPAIAAWVAPERAAAVGGVHGFGMMDYYWRSTIFGGKPQVCGFFFLGDTQIRSNPKFGRGCTWSAVAAHRLAGILATTADPDERVVRYERALEEEFRADWRTMLANDASIKRQFEIALGRRRATIRDRVVARLDAAVNDALVTDPVVFRAVWTSYHGFTEMAAWTRRVDIWGRVIKLMALGPGKFRPALEQLRQRPSRREMFAVQSGQGAGK